MPKQVLEISHAEARRLMELAMECLAKHKVPGAVAIVDRGGHLVTLERADNTMYAAARIAIGKASTCVAFQRATHELETTILSGRTPMLVLNGATSDPYIPLKGGRPVQVEDQIIGAIAIAGTMDAEMDEKIALETLTNYFKTTNFK